LKVWFLLLAMFPEIQTVQEDVFDDQTQQQTLVLSKSGPQQMS
jgi:hypothetical protein